MPSGMLDPTKLDAGSRARVITFQTWLGVEDTQILLALQTGRLLSIDHGAWCSDPSSRTSPVIGPTPGVPDHFARERTIVEAALERIENLKDEELLAAVAQMPEGPEWNASRDRRLALAEWLAWRRQSLREAIRRWWTT
jgi:hypothetical protein